MSMLRTKAETDPENAATAKARLDPLIFENERRECEEDDAADGDGKKKSVMLIKDSMQ